MGKNKNNAVAETKFIPRISSASRKIAARRIEQSTSQGIPHFMREIKSRVPLAPITSNENTFFTRVRREITESKESNETDPLLKTPGKETLKPIAMNKQPSVLLDDNVFTFRPKVSSTSAKIVENMGTDFMARQQQHLEKQKKLIERAGYSFKSSPGHLSPLSQYKRLKERGFKIDETDNNNTNSQPIDLDQPETPKSDASGDDLSDTMPSLQRNNSGISAGLQRILDGPYSNGNPDMVLKRHKTRIRSHNKGNKSVGDNSDMEDFRDDIENGSALSRSKTMPSLGRPKLTRKITAMAQSSDRLTKAKDQAEKAIRLKKVFTIQGGYSAIRQCLRRRGWVEKFYRIPAPQKTTKKRRRKGDDDENDDGDDDDDDDDGDDDDDTDSDNDQPKVAPWEEDDGIYGIMSRIVRNVNPTFIWVLKRDVIDYRFLTKDQMVNHYCKAGSFTTKVGLCVNMRQVPWFDESDPDEFYPRCYRLSHEEEKAAFIDDFRLTSCVNILKIVTNQYMEGGECNEESRDKDTITKEPTESSQPFECTNPECTRSRPNQTTDNLCAHALQKQAEDEKKRKEKELLASDEEEENTTAGMEVEYDENGVIKPPDSSRRKSQQKKKRVIVPQKCLDRAIVQCEKYLTFRSHDDIDQATERDSLSPAQWDEMIVWYYQLVHEGGIIPNVPASILGQIENILNRVKAVWPQFELDGVKNVWIVKPGAKSRGRGITCYDRLEEMLKLVNSQVVRKDNKYVVQKYIERPLLIHNCKFDIRQWFLVTDWNPLTLYFYQDSYLRFCSQQFTLEDYDESIHLSNNAIQKHYKNGPRSTELPEENMWTHDQFKDYIKNQGYSNLWDDMIYPGMKKAIVCALLSTQDLVEYRKSSFELYGADFMLTEDYKPWLIEINSSPSMESSTEITSRLCANVLEDTLKVVLDRKWDRNCDIGRFELAFKQPLVTVPPYIGINLCAEGGAIKKPGWMNVVKKTTNESELVFSPRKEKQVIFNDKLMGSSVEPVSKTAGNSRRPHSENQEDHNSSAKPVNSAPVKKSSNREASDSNSHHVKKKSHSKSPKILNNMSNQMNQSNSNTSVVAEKSNSDSASVYSHQQSENGRNDENTEDDVRSERRIIHSTSSSPILAPKMSMFGSGAIPSTNYVPSLASKKIVSRTSVSTNYTIPSDNRERPALSVNNVETTDLKTLKAQAKGVYPLTESTWNRTCVDCGNGMNLYLDSINPFCKCRQDGIRISPDPLVPRSPRARSAHNRTARPHSRTSPRPPSASGIHSKGLTNVASESGSKAPSSKMLLRYTDAGIQRPITPYLYTGTNNLQRQVRKYISRRIGQYHELSDSQNAPIFIDTSRLSGALSIVSHSYFSK